MNPIEHVWSYLERRLRRRDRLPTNSDQLWAALEEWYKIPTQYIRKLYASMPARLTALRHAGGYATTR